MQKIFTLLLMIIWGNSIIIAQTPYKSEKIITDYINGKTYIEQDYISSEINNNYIKNLNNSDEATLVWEAEAPYAICKSVGISDETYQSFVGWRVNDEAWSLYNETSSTPEWTFDINGAEYLPQDITSDGSYMVGANGNTIYGFIPSSNIPDWTFNISNFADDIFNIVLSNDGETVYFVSGDDYDYSFITSVDISTSTENWSFALPEGGYMVSLVLSAN
ncbi:MAG: hypothetical protein GQ527_06175 [Bacteroidales bacterium]|nr:hypothetical protein [Bacteroidales bacterium]